MTSGMTPAQALVAFLESIPQGDQPPWFGDLVTAATTIADPRDAAVIFTLLGAAGSYGSATPPTDPLVFPQDHQMHPTMGTEWYWYSFNVTVDGTDGLDRIGGFATVKRVRAVSNAIEAAAGWSDTEAQVASTTATLTLATRDRYETVRRRPNVQWPALGGDVELSVAGQPFLFRNGPDSLSGTIDVMPLKVHIDDAPHMVVDVTMTPALPAPCAFFTQEGKLSSAGFAGFYYSWPQLAVEGSVTVDGRTFSVHGTGWVCHQMIMLLDPAVPPSPPPPSAYVAPDSVAGWSWCQFNLANGDAFTAVAAQSGTMRDQLLVPYGWYLRRQDDAWQRTYLTGSLQLDRFVPGLEGVMIPSSWRYAATDLASGGRGVDAGVMAVPWYPDGSFHDFDRQVQAETPVDVALVNAAGINAQNGRGTALTGSGYCESVGYEPLQSYVKRALAYLKRGQS